MSARGNFKHVIWNRALFQGVAVLAVFSIAAVYLSVQYDIIPEYTNYPALTVPSTNTNYPALTVPSTNTNYPVLTVPGTNSASPAKNTGITSMSSSKPLRASHSATCQSAISSSALPTHTEDVMHIAIASCGVSIYTVGIALIKSLALFSRPGDVIVLHTFVLDGAAVRQLGDLMDETFAMPDRHLCYAIYQATFPSQSWAGLFRPCAAQRLFLQYALPNLKKIIYVDADTIFLRPIADVWSEFTKFNDEQICGLAREVDEAYQGGYTKGFRPLYPPPAGLNSGVFFVHLERMRQLPWIDLLSKLLRDYNKYVTLGDQDLLNIYFHFQPNAYYRLPCSFNYRTDTCMWNCSDASQHGIAILHAHRMILTMPNVKHPFRNLFESISRLHTSNFRLNDTTLLYLFEKAVLSNNGDIKCCQTADIFTAGLKS